MPQVSAKITQFQVYGDVLYALDSEGSLWKNTHPPTSEGWKALPGPTIRQHAVEDRAIRDRITWDISSRESRQTGSPPL